MQELLDMVEYHGIDLQEVLFRDQIRGFYGDGVIWIDKRLNYAEKRCKLAEELGHFYMNKGNLLDLKDYRAIKQEYIGRKWAYEMLMPMNLIISAIKSGVSTFQEIVDYLNVTEEFAVDAINYYKKKYGESVTCNKYRVNFSPLRIEGS